MKVVIVEDDYQQAELITSWLLERWPQLDIQRIGTEAAFRSLLSDPSFQPPNIFIIDIMLRWADPSPDIEVPPDEVIVEGPYRAGLRCVDLIRKTVATSHIPSVLYSVLDQRDVDDNLTRLRPQVMLLTKSSKPDELLNLVGSLIAVQQPTKRLTATSRDIFICHASEDKETVVDPLVTALENSGITVWHDRAEIRWGDSLISKVEEGLRISRYVLAVLSKHSVTKPWPRRELNAALNREATSGEIKVLPLIVGSADERTLILLECALQNDKLYEIWEGSPEPIVERLKQRL